MAPAKPSGKNAPEIERFQELLARLCGGCDATQIPGLSMYLVLQLISEVGTDMSRWQTEKHFSSWLGLAGGRKHSGKRKGSVKVHRNRAGRIFCAAARGLALLFYRLLRYGTAYVEKGLKAYEAKVLETETRLLQKLAKKQGFTLIQTISA